MFGFGKPKSLVGLDIGSSAVKAVQLKASSKGYRVTAIATEPVPHQSIVDGAIMDGGAVSAAIGRLFEQQKGFRSSDVAASLSGSAVIVKKINLPVMTEAELAQAIYWEAEQYIPFDIQDVSLDYQILEPGVGLEMRGAMEVLLVAAKRDKVNDYTGVIREAGKQAAVVDVDAFALQNCYEVNYGVDERIVALLNAGASAINVNVVRNGQSLFTRDVSLGGNAYTEAVQRELNLPFELAELAKKGIPIEECTFDEVRPVLHAVTQNVLLEIQKTFDFFRATADADRIDAMVLSGGAAAVDGFAEALASRFNVPVESFDPFRRISIDAETTVDVSELAATSAVAVGLALRRAGDR